jgi:purine/pyrimidine-nucleoside phosphorylase
MSALPTHFVGVTVHSKANVYFGGDVVSYTILLPGDVKKTLGIIRSGTYHFGTDAAERMEIVDGRCRVTLDGGASAADYGPGDHFEIPRQSGFTIEVKDGLCQYICSFLP